jgi:S-adenosylmethionine-diacylglycerol 3-amino-3-carboxypropyl transferase
MRSTLRANQPLTAELLGAAVHRSDALTAAGLRERLFALAFRRLVYAQIWEDPRIDMEALAIEPTSRVVAIASGGCNVLSYLVASPARITAVDLNSAHVALVKLKLAAARNLPDYASFHALFANAACAANVTNYERHIRTHLDSDTRAYWENRDLLGRSHIGRFRKGFYRYGLLGRFIGICHALARSLGVDPRILMTARTLEEQHAFFERHVAPLFQRRIVRRLLDSPLSLYGLGIPPAQYQALLGDAASMADVVCDRLRTLACAHPLGDNYFAWQAFARSYGSSPEAPLPPYLQPDNFDAVRTRADRVQVLLTSMTAHLERQPPASVDRYVLLDAQDWMGDGELTRLWREITRTATPGARVIFRTAARPDLLPGRVPDTVLGKWRYAADTSREFSSRDRSAIYGGFHLYMREDRP